MEDADYKFGRNFLIYFIICIVIMTVLLFVEYAAQPEGKIYSTIKLVILGIVGLLLLSSYLEGFSIWPILYFLLYILIVYIYDKFGLDSDDWQFLLARAASDSFLSVLAFYIIFRKR